VAGSGLCSATSCIPRAICASAQAAARLMWPYLSKGFAPWTDETWVKPLYDNAFHRANETKAPWRWSPGRLAEGAARIGANAGIWLFARPILQSMNPEKSALDLDPNRVDAGFPTRSMLQAKNLDHVRSIRIGSWSRSLIPTSVQSPDSTHTGTVMGRLFPGSDVAVIFPTSVSGRRAAGDNMT